MSNPNKNKIPPGLEIKDKRERLWLAFWLSPDFLFKRFKGFFNRGGRKYPNSPNDIRTRIQTAIPKGKKK